MARTTTKRNWYYVAVLCENCIKLVTKVEYEPYKQAYWNLKDKPKDFTKDFAEQLALGLCVNGNQAYVLISNWELESQLYMEKE